MELQFWQLLVCIGTQLILESLFLKSAFYFLCMSSVDSLAYLTLDNLLEATGTNNAGFCSACLTGDYPVEIPVNLSKKILEKSIHRLEISAATPQQQISGGFQQPLSEIHE